MKLNSQTNQEIMSQRNQEHMMMPSYPTPHLVMIHTDFTFGLLEDSFNWPSHSADPDKLTQRSAERSIAEKVFDLSRIIQITANDQPEFIGGQATARFGHTQKCKITNDRPLATFFDNCLGPILLLDLLHQLLDWNGLLSFIAQMQTSRMTPMTSPFRNMNLGRTTPDQGILFDGCEVKRSRGAATPSRNAELSPYRASAANQENGKVPRFIMFFNNSSPISGFVLKTRSCGTPQACRCSICSSANH